MIVEEDMKDINKAQVEFIKGFEAGKKTVPLKSFDEKTADRRLKYANDKVDSLKKEIIDLNYLLERYKAIIRYHKMPWYKKLLSKIPVLSISIKKRRGYEKS